MHAQLGLLAPSRSPSGGQENTEPAFEAFWQAYPDRPNNPKATARAAWRRARKTTAAEDILDGLARYQFSADPRFRPMAATWLHQERWLCVSIDLAADAWGLAEFTATLPASDALSAACYDRAALDPILLATGWPETWRGPLDVLDAWLRDGYEPPSIARVIAEAVAEFGPRERLAAFDRRVRFRAVRIGGST
jgi:hypothetical protein